MITLASRLLSLEFAEPTKVKKKYRTGPVRTVGTDRSALATVVGDLADSFAGRWATIDLHAAPTIFANTNVNCLVLHPLPSNAAVKIDKALRKLPYYHGAAEIDAGNATHHQRQTSSGSKRWQIQCG